MDDIKLKRKQRGLRKDNRIQVTLTIGHDENGAPIKKSFYGKNRTEAEAKRENYKLQLRMGITADSKITVSQWTDRCLQLYRTKVDEAYVVNDTVPYNRMKRAIGRMLVADVREADLQKLLNDVSHMSFSTVSKYYQAIRLVFSRARRNKLIYDDPSENLEMPNTNKGSHRALERSETDTILQHWHEHRCGTWAMLMLLAGLRRGELIALNWQNVDMGNRQLTINSAARIKSNQSKIVDKPKTKAGFRIIPICNQLYDCLDCIQENERIGLVCTMATGKQISASGFRRGWDSFNHALKLNVKAHDLRHTFATALYDANVDVKSAQYYLGHADIRMTLDLYTHLSKERENTQRSRLVTFLDGWLVNGHFESTENHEKTAMENEF